MSTTRDFVSTAARGDVAKLRTFPTTKDDHQWRSGVFDPEAVDLVEGDPIGPVNTCKCCAHCFRAVCGHTADS